MPFSPLTRGLTKANSMLNNESPYSVMTHKVQVRRTRQVVVDAEMERLEITISNNPCGAGVVVSALGGDGNASRAGIHLGDCIVDVNGEPVSSHEHAMELMRSTSKPELVLTLVGHSRKLCIDKSEGGKLEITVTNTSSTSMTPKRGVEVERVGVMGLAAGAGIRAGDCILAVNGSLVDDHAKAIEAMDAAERWLELVVEQSELDYA